jgi:hypothetical protein
MDIHATLVPLFSNRGRASLLVAVQIDDLVLSCMLVYGWFVFRGRGSASASVLRRLLFDNAGTIVVDDDGFDVLASVFVIGSQPTEDSCQKSINNQALWPGIRFADWAKPMIVYTRSVTYCFFACCQEVFKVEAVKVTAGTATDWHTANEGAGEGVENIEGQTGTDDGEVVVMIAWRQGRLDLIQAFIIRDEMVLDTLVSDGIMVDHSNCLDGDRKVCRNLVVFMSDQENLQEIFALNQSISNVNGQIFSMGEFSPLF